ncbi:Uncharacterized protein BM_BM1248 [Brugia malayi]|uniref:Bm1248 n=1 Tax=Brugia malayi TaxID=6279 RepID=A0A0J9XRA9_BRUMA|nr:Uncharacterized protein BM_BM1248 [Brugia malayi]CDP94081.1 Bm1248 [Brugia malayi]VIO88657.1 Uncharacterized protein BM_BM1248 [Brugia malayi]
MHWWTIATLSLTIAGTMTLFGYTTYLLFHQIDEENHDEWEEGYLPNYPKIPWHLDGAKLT